MITAWDTNAPHLNPDGSRRTGEWWLQVTDEDEAESLVGSLFQTVGTAGGPSLSAQAGELGDPADLVQAAVREAIARKGVPPSGNTGAQNTSPSVPAHLVLDTFEGTWVEGSAEFVRCLLTPDGVSEAEWCPLPSGRNGYREGAIRGKIRVYWNGGAGMGVHADLSSQALRQLEEEGVNLQEALALWLESGCKPSRCDVAVDDREGILSPEQIEECVRAGLAVSRWQVSEGRGRDKLSTGEREGGWTRYFGAPQSRMLLRIYDKQAERISKGLPDPGHWMRVEFQGRKERAGLLARSLLAEDAGEVVCGLLRGYLEFKEAPSDSADTNRSRWKPQPWWKAFLEDAAKRKVGVPQPEPNLERAANWFVRQVAPIYALLRLAEEYGDGWLEEALDKGARRLQKWQLKALGVITEPDPPLLA